MSKQSREQSRTERAAAVRAAQVRKERNRRVALVVGIVVLLGAVIAAGAWYGGGGGSNSTTTASGAKSVSAGTTYLGVGDPKAPVKVVVYEDFLCPYCRELEVSTRDFLHENADKGRVYVEYHPINLLRQYAYSAKALNAWVAVLKNASPAAALSLHNLLFDKQPYEQSADQVSDSQIADWVKQAGGDNANVRNAMKSKDTAFFDAMQAEMNKEKIAGTPTVFINGKELPVAEVTQMVSQIESAVEQGNQ
ncbi:MAG TPA: thioredoxin domain-containing protein [Propionibacteriaceae bacterium]|nr:thioredoxin domain-containing protein [Propionibacteriaceae bacterium]